MSGTAAYSTEQVEHLDIRTSILLGIFSPEGPRCTVSATKSCVVLLKFPSEFVASPRLPIVKLPPMLTLGV